MANADYDALANCLIPNLTPMEYRILAHYVTRYNRKDEKAWPPFYELVNITGGATRTSIERSKSGLVKKGFLIRVTKGHKGVSQAEYRPNFPLIETYRVPVEKHLKAESVPVELDRVPMEKVESVRTEFREFPIGNPKPNKPNKPKNVESYDRFNDLILKNVPTELQATVTAGRNFDLVLDELSDLGVTDQAIGSAINLITWATVEKAGAIVLITLKALIADRSKALAKEAYEAEKSRQLDLERREAEKNKATDEVRDRVVQSLRKQLGTGL